MWAGVDADDGGLQTIPRIIGAGVLTQSRRIRTGSVLEHVIAHGLPAVDEVLFLRAASALSSIGIVGMEMRRAVRNGFLQSYVTFQSLMQIPGLCNVDGNPITVRQQFGIDVNARQRPEGSIQGINLVVICFARLPGPIVNRG
jgi:hypothetical protein